MILCTYLNIHFLVNSLLNSHCSHNQLVRMNLFLGQSHLLMINNFGCFYCPLIISLEGSPEEVGGNFDCSYACSLKYLVGSPKKVGGNFECIYCDSLKSLCGCPQELGGDLDCRNCTKLKSLDWTPDNIGGVIKVSTDMILDVDLY